MVTNVFRGNDQVVLGNIAMRCYQTAVEASLARPDRSKLGG